MVEIIPKPAEKLPVRQNILFYFSLGLLLLVVFSYFILGHYLKKAEITQQNLDENLKTLSKEKTIGETALEKKVLGYQKKIEDFSKLINLHLFPSNFFEFIEKNIHPQIWFSELTLKPRRGEVNLSGEAENFTILSQQLQIFRANPKVSNLNLTEITIGKEGRVGFGLDIIFDPTLFK